MNVFKIGSDLDKLKKLAGEKFEAIKHKLEGPQAFLNKAKTQLLPIVVKIGPWLLKKAMDEGVITAEDLQVATALEKEAEQYLPVLVEVEQEALALGQAAVKVAQ